MLSIAQMLVSDNSHRLVVNTMSANTNATNAFESGSRYFSSVVEMAEARSAVNGEPDLATTVIFLILMDCQ